MINQLDWWLIFFALSVLLLLCSIWTIVNASHMAVGDISVVVSIGLPVLQMWTAGFQMRIACNRQRFPNLLNLRWMMKWPACFYFRRLILQTQAMSLSETSVAAKGLYQSLALPIPTTRRATQSAEASWQQSKATPLAIEKSVTVKKVKSRWPDCQQGHTAINPTAHILFWWLLHVVMSLSECKAGTALRCKNTVCYLHWCALTQVPIHCFQTGLLAKYRLQWSLLHQSFSWRW